MKALVIGFGSIGSRHVRVLKHLGLNTAVVSNREINQEHAYSNIFEAVADWNPDYAIIANRTTEHINAFEALAEAGFRGILLVEKPLFNRTQEFPRHNFSNVFVAYNLRFHPVISRLKELIEGKNILLTHAYVGQFLPSWRPGIDYRKVYSAIKSEGGGVLRDLSHELDYLNWLLGGWTKLAAIGGKFSNLEIDSEDTFSILIKTPLCPSVSLQLNYLDSINRRELTVITADNTIVADIVNCSINLDGQVEKFICDSDYTYIAQHRAILANQYEVLCSINQGLDVLKIIDAAEVAAKKDIWVSA
ncbi:MAG: Gfo/Idh/MocA family oxidoreductase [Pseudomonadota bacterium]|nr:Gfo/Idh/MocA family oxidoreductase [Pseudomonadota bacterium]